MGKELLQCFGVACFAVVAIAIIYWRQAVRGRRESARFRSLQPISDEVFLHECSLQPGTRGAEVALEVRRILGEMSDVPPQNIRATDRFFVELKSLPPWDSPDILDFVLTLEDKFKMQLDRTSETAIAGAISGPDSSVRDLVTAVISCAGK